VQACAERDPAVAARAFALTDRSHVYGFYDHDDGGGLVVAYRSVAVEDLSALQRLRAYMRYLWFAEDDVFYLCHYERLEVFLTALILRLRGKRVFVMNDSKFDDYERRLPRELGKSVLYAPYNGALVSGERSASYLRFLGVRGKIETGYDTIDVRAAALDALEPPDIGLPNEYFIAVNRLVAKKNIGLTIRAFQAACREIDKPVELLIVGEGPEETSLRAMAETLGIKDKVRFLGEVPNRKAISLIARAKALILVSKSEQWGLVVNEAVACGVPVIVSEAVGAHDSLVRNLVSGFVVESDNEPGLARAMLAILRGSQQLAASPAEMYAASVDRFADAVSSLIKK
jgi:glycosyltransferase involved in cell wall biosynthesis